MADDKRLKITRGNKVVSASNLENGELYFNTRDKKIYLGGGGDDEYGPAITIFGAPDASSVNVDRGLSNVNNSIGITNSLTLPDPEITPRLFIPTDMTAEGLIHDYEPISAIPTNMEGDVSPSLINFPQAGVGSSNKVLSQTGNWVSLQATSPISRNGTTFGFETPYIKKMAKYEKHYQASNRNLMWRYIYYSNGMTNLMFTTSDPSGIDFNVNQPTNGGYYSIWQIAFPNNTQVSGDGNFFNEHYQAFVNFSVLGLSTVASYWCEGLTNDMVKIVITSSASKLFEDMWFYGSIWGKCNDVPFIQEGTGANIKQEEAI